MTSLRREAAAGKTCVIHTYDTYYTQYAIHTYDTYYTQYYTLTYYTLRREAAAGKPREGNIILNPSV